MEVREFNRLYLLTYPRTASNLLTKILSLDKQPNVTARASGGYFFLPALMKSHELGVRAKNISDWEPDQAAGMLQTYRECVEDMVQYVDDADEKGKKIFIKEHAAFLLEPTEICKYLHGAENVKEKPWVFPLPGHQETERAPDNLTMLPDDFLKTFSPTFLIRHPALAFVSHYRAFLDIQGKEVVERSESDFMITMTLRWTRLMYEWFSKNLTEEQAKTNDPEISWPIVIDGDDVMGEPRVLQRWCKAIGLDPDQMRFSWEKTDTAGMGHQDNPITARMLSTISASTGIKKGLSSEGISIDAEVEKWTAEFGEVGAKMLEKHVRAAMPDYEYLKSKRLTA